MRGCFLLAQVCFPIIHWEDNRIFDGNGQAFGIYRLPQFPYAHRSDSEKLAVNEQFERFLHSYVGKGKLLSLARQKSLGQVEEQMRQRSAHPRWKEHVDAALDELAYNQTYDREVFLVLPLRTTAGAIQIDTVFSDQEHLKKAAKAVWKQAWNVVTDIPSRIVGAERDLPFELIRSAYEADRHLFTSLQGSFGGAVKRATPADIEWIHRKPYYRGLREPNSVLPEKLPTVLTAKRGTGLIRPNRATTLYLAAAHVKEDWFRIRIQHRDKTTSYQSVMALVNFMESLEDLGDEWLYYPLENLEFPIDVCIDFTVTPGHIARQKVRRKKSTARDQLEEFEKDGDVPLDLEDGLIDAPYLEQKLKGGMPLVEMQVFLAIGAKSEEKLLEQEKTLINHFDGYGKPVHPPGDAKALWQAFFPGTTGGIHTSWQIPSEPRVLSSAAPLGTSRLGDPGGMLLGHLIGGGQAVFYDPTYATQILNHTGSIACVGTMGGGKSATMKYIADMILSLGGEGFAIDPKKEEYYKLFDRWRSEAYWIRYSADSNEVFTPFHLGRDANESRIVASSWLHILLSIAGSKEDKYGSIIVEAALMRLYKGDTWDMDTFIQCLMHEVEQGKTETEREIGFLYYRMLEQLREDPIGRCIFGPDTPDRSVQSARLVVQSISGLDLPGEDQKDPKLWRPSQRFAVSMLYLSSEIGFHKLMMADPSILKFFLIDEGWMLRAIPEGRALINKVLLMGRALNIILLLGVQNADVLLPSKDAQNDDIAGNLGWIFIFKLESQNQVDAAIRILNLPGHVNWFQKFAKFYGGHGMARDPLGRVGEIQIQILPEYLKDVYSTTPGEQKQAPKSHTQKRKLRLV
jgi:hypothetical protein